MAPIITCGAVIERRGKVLLTRREISPYRGYWCLPGGHLEPGEKAAEAVKREVREEVGLDFKPKFLKYYDEIIPEIKWHAVALFFSGKAAGRIKIDKREVKEYKWASREEALNLKLAFTNGRVLADYYASRG